MNKKTEWSEEEIEYLKNLLLTYNRKHGAIEFIKKYPNKSMYAVLHYIDNNHLKFAKMKIKRPDIWTDEEIAYLKELYATCGGTEASIKFRERYPHRTVNAVHSMAVKRLKLKVNPEASIRYMKSLDIKSRFKKGRETDSLPIGAITTRHHKDKKGNNSLEYQFIKVSDDRYKNNFMFLHRYIWEKHNGPIPKGHMVIHKDGNVHNNDISNLALVKDPQEKGMLKNYIGTTPEVFEAGHNLVRLRLAIKKREKEKK